MNRPLFPCLALAAALLLAACTEQSDQQSMQEPSSVATANAVAPDCDLTGVNSGIEAYFSGNQKVTVRGYRDAMVSASTLTASRVQGFNILREIGIRARTVPTLAATGSALAVGVLKCVFTSTELADANVIEQTPALTSTFFVEELGNGGGFGVRNASGDPTGPVQGVKDGIVIAGIAPPAPVNATSWSASLGTQRVLFYGNEGTTVGSYHWAVVPRGATFDPELVVTTCVNDEATGTDPADPNLMLTESGVGVLAFEDATYIGCGSAPVAMAPASGFDFLGRLADLGRMLLPQPAVATVVLPGTVGGRAGGVKSLFGPHTVETAQLTVTTQPPVKTKVGVQFPIRFQSVTPGPFTVNGTLITIVAVNNNGVPTALFLDLDGSGTEHQPFKCGEPGLPTCTVETTSVGTTNGLAEFFISVTKPGAIKFLATGIVDDRETEVFGAITNKSNLGPGIGPRTERKGRLTRAAPSCFRSELRAGEL